MSPINETIIIARNRASNHLLRLLSARESLVCSPEPLDAEITDKSFEKLLDRMLNGANTEQGELLSCDTTSHPKLYAKYGIEERAETCQS